MGGEGVVLTAGRSLAIDHTQLAYGLPIFADIAPPSVGGAPATSDGRTGYRWGHSGKPCAATYSGVW